MKKVRNILLISVLLISFNGISQRFSRSSLEMSVGYNKYSDKLGDSRGDILVNTGYRYMLTRTFGLQGFWQFDVIKSKDYYNHTQCEYSVVSNLFRIEMFKKLARFGRFNVNATTGLGATFYYLENDQRARVFNYTAAGNVFYAIGQNRNPWGAIKLEYRGTANTSQDYTLNNNFRTTSTPIQAFKQDISLGFIIYLDQNSKTTHADWVNKKRKNRIVTNNIVTPTIKKIDTIIVQKEIKQEMVIPHEVVLFEEGSDEINTDSQRTSIIKMAEFLDKHPDVKIEVVGASCGGKGSAQRNLELSISRAKKVYDKIASLRGNDYSRLSYRGTGVDTKYKHKDQDVQKRVNFIIYK